MSITPQKAMLKESRDMSLLMCLLLNIISLVARESGTAEMQKQSWAHARPAVHHCIALK